MAHTFKILPQITLACMIEALALTGCHSKATDESQILVVERQYVKLEGVSPDGWDYAEFAVDVPIKGPQPLLDSIKAFMNETLYKMCEIKKDTPRYSTEEVYTDNMYNLLTSYANKYAGYLKENVEWFVSNNIFLIAQTESFVTYGIECFHGSGSTGSEFFCYSFSTKDGCRIKDIMNWQDIKRFIDEHPNAEHPYDQWQLQSDVKDNKEWKIYDVGLLYNGLLLVNEDQANHYVIETIPYKEILTYLSKDAQNLVKNIGVPSEWEDFFIGERLATVSTRDNRVIELTVVPAWHDWAQILCEDNTIIDLTHNSCCDDATLMAFYVDNGECLPADVIDGHSVLTKDWDELQTTAPNEDCPYAYDPETKKLYVPSTENVTMGYHECNDRYRVYNYNNRDGFVYEGEDGGFWLHPSIRQFGRLCRAVKTKNYLIRIDEMRIYDVRYGSQYEAARTDTCRYRYTAWKENDNMLDKPDLVINDGYLSEEGYVFTNDGYKYVVNISDDSQGWLFVYHGDRLILKQCLRDYRFKSVLSFDWDC